MPATNFQGLTVLTLESRRGLEMSRLIETYGGKPLLAPAMREVPLSSNPEALMFADALFSGRIDTMIFLTGVGATAFSKVLQAAHPAEKFLEALSKISVVACGPKPVAVLRQWKVPIAITVPEPNKLDLRDKRVAVQECGFLTRSFSKACASEGLTLHPCQCTNGICRRIKVHCRPR